MRKIASFLLVVVVLFGFNTIAFADSSNSQSPMTVVDEFDRNRLDADTEPGGMVDDTSSSSSSSGSSESEDETEDEDKMSMDDVEAKKLREENTSLLDTTIFVAGVLCFMIDLIYAMLYTCWKVIPNVGSVMLRVVTLNKKDSFEDTVGTFILKILGITVLGTLFTTGYFKLILFRLYGWILQIF